jgi:adenine-specific DNA-methyltransferase
MGIFINDDCVAAMRNIKAGSVDLIVTSPPYNAGKAYASYEDSKSVDDYKQFAENWIAAVPRTLSPTGSFWLNVGYTKLSDTETMPLTYLYYPILIQNGFHMIQEIVWHYEGGMSYKKRFSHRTERWMWCVRDPKNFVFNLDDIRDMSLNRTIDKRNNPLGKNPTDYWYYDRVVGGTGATTEKKNHPCQFPVPMLSRIIKACSHEGQTILDPFGGSGSTALAATRLNRDFISIEMDEGYHQISQDRLL